MLEIFFSFSILLLSQMAAADQSPNTKSQLPNILNTNHQCVQLARTILKHDKPDKIAGTNNVAELIKCLEGDYYYFDRGAAKLALVHIGQPAVPLLINALKDSDFRISEGAAFALGMMGPNAKLAVPVLKEILRQKPQPGMRLQRDVAIALGKIGEVDFLILALQGKEENIQPYLASQGLGGAGPSAAAAVPALLKILNGPDHAAQMYAADALGAIGPAANPAVPRLRELSRSSLNFVRRSAGEALLKIGTAEAMEAAEPYERRKHLVDGFFKAMSIFIAMPWLAAVLGIGFGAMAFATARNNIKRKFTARLLYTTAIFWLVYAAWEFYSGLTGANIRVDLLFIYPILFLVTIVSLILWLIGLGRSKGSNSH